MKILIVVNKLSGGGAEKVAVNLANYLCKNHDVNVLTLSDAKDYYSLNQSIKRLHINQHSRSGNLWEGFKSNLERIFQLKNTILSVNPDVVITFMNRANIRVLISLFFSSIPVIITEHNFPKDNPMKPVWEILRRIMYRRAAYLVSVSKGISDYFSYLTMDKRKVIYNPTELKFNVKEKSPLDLTKKNIIAMGRLVPIKGFDLLIEAFKQIADDFPNWNLSIIGEGECFGALMKQINTLFLNDRVFLLGFKPEPHQIIKDSDLFVLSSRSEGLGNVILEAMKCGVPVLSTDCPVGPRELIVNGVSGLLIDNDNVEAMVNGLKKLLSDEKLRKQIVENAFNKLDKFSNSKIFSEWDKLLELSQIQSK